MFLVLFLFGFWPFAFLLFVCGLVFAEANIFNVDFSLLSFVPTGNQSPCPPSTPLFPSFRAQLLLARPSLLVAPVAWSAKLS